MSRRLYSRNYFKFVIVRRSRAYRYHAVVIRIDVNDDNFIVGALFLFMDKTVTN